MIRYLKAGGKERPFLFSFRAIDELTEDKTIKAGSFKHIAKACFLGFKYGALKQKQEVDFTQESVFDWLDDDLKMVNRMAKIMETAMNTINSEEEDKEEGE